MCSAKLNEPQINEALRQYEEGLHLESEGKMLQENAKKLMSQECKDTDIQGFQSGHWKFQRVYRASYKSYPKENLLKTFSEEQLEPCAKVVPAIWYSTVVDMLKEKKVKE